jgi:hypothetical protein
MKLEQIDVTIGTDGKIHLQTSGFSGSVCLEATKELEELLGNQVIDRNMTADYYDSVVNQTADKLKIRH